MHGLARLIAAALVAAAVLACDRTAQRPGVDGLVEFLERRQGEGAGPPLGGCWPSAEQRAALVTPPYRDVRIKRLDMAAVERVWRRSGAVHARVLYANDLEVPAGLRRSRPVVPVGQPPLVASIGGRWIPALFVFRGRWWCVGGDEREIVNELKGDCRDAYRGSASGRCFDFTAPLAAAVLSGDEATRERLCALMVAHGCGSVPAEAPPPPEPSP